MSAQGHTTAPRARSRGRVLLVTVGIVLSLTMVEAVLQLAVYRGIPTRLADPEAYAHPLCDAWYWRTLAQQGPPSEGQIAHPTFGWIPSGEARGEDGVWRPDQRVEGPPVVMVGDSFLAGTTPYRDRIAAVIQDDLTARGVAAQVEDHAAGGYGLDQILLRLKDRAQSLQSGTPVVIGIMTTDIDRAVLWEREAPKPRFELGEGGGLILKTDHLADPMPAPEGRVLIWARWREFWAGMAARDEGLPHADCRVAEKQVLAKALLKSVTAVCVEAELRCLVVPFLRAEDLERPPGWREVLIQTQTTSLAQLSLRPLLKGTEQDLYGTDRHPTVAQNRFVGTAIGAWVARALGESAITTDGIRPIHSLSGEDQP